MKRNTILILILTFLIITSSIVYANDICQTQTQIQVAGTIRNAGKGWQVINNSSHIPVNITGVKTDMYKIAIYHDINATKVITFVVTTDETMAAEGYTVGISGGLDYSYIYIYDKNHNRINPNNYINGGGNIWIYGILTNQ
jgi:hypothetical protein